MNEIIRHNFLVFVVLLCLAFCAGYLYANRTTTYEFNKERAKLAEQLRQFDQAKQYYQQEIEASRGRVAGTISAAFEAGSAMGTEISDARGSVDEILKILDSLPKAN